MVRNFWMFCGTEQQQSLLKENEIIYLKSLVAQNYLRQRKFIQDKMKYFCLNGYEI